MNDDKNEQTTGLFVTNDDNKSEWSEKYYGDNLNAQQHAANNKWFESMLSLLTDDGKLHVPNLGKAFNKKGDEIPSDVSRN